ncbi:MAG: hypothetical protein ACYDBJ_26835 [Aggregatilineales bacterium]
MSPTIWVITESDWDYEVFKTILRGKGQTSALKRLQMTGGSQGIGALVKQLPTLMRAKRAAKDWREDDCIAVLHDTDAQTMGRQEVHYKAIDDLCKKQSAVHLIVNEKIEAWLLADGGICRFLESAVGHKIRRKSWDSSPNVKTDLENFLGQAKMSHIGRDKTKLLDHLDGTGDEHSPSLKKAIRDLQDAGCL